MNVEVFSVIVRTNEKRYIKWHQTSKCQCRLDASVYNIKKYGMKINGDVNNKEVIDKGTCDKGFNSNSSNCECQCNK